MPAFYLAPEELALCKTALEEACRDFGAISSDLRSEMASRILAKANTGERDPEKLKSAATAWILAA